MNLTSGEVCFSEIVCLISVEIFSKSGTRKCKIDFSKYVHSEENVLVKTIIQLSSPCGVGALDELKTHQQRTSPFNRGPFAQMHKCTFCENPLKDPKY